MELLALPRDDLLGARRPPERNVAPQRMLPPESERTPEAATQPPIEIAEESEPPPFVLFRRAHQQAFLHGRMY